ncbi:MAG: MoaD/ThiS family protein [Deltaproteobacteria bacterium]|nr:MoaD/ThiS family protein [Deltaproteobacteria bacterium]MBW2415909.1 MoaD/ThiS family protein [Deltaproteobacteria bacterium]
MGDGVLEVRFYATFRPLVGAASVELPLAADASVRDLLADILERWPALRPHLLDDAGGLGRRVLFLVDGRPVRYLEHGLDTRIGPGTPIDVFPAVAGGGSAKGRAPGPPAEC